MLEIPLFPLPLVLFPQVVIPLHIFEARYRLMINRSIEESSSFGIVLIPPGTAAENETTIRRTGVAARVGRFERLPDGRLNIMATGERKFRILQFTGNDPYWTAEIEYVDDYDSDDDSNDRLQESADEVRRLYRDLHRFGSQPHIPESPASLAHMVSYVLDIPIDAKQDLLEMASVTERLQTLAGHLKQAVKRLNARFN